MKIAKAGRTAAFCLLAICATASPVSACMSSGPDGFTSGLIWKTKPHSLPNQTIALEVEKVRPIARSWGFVATVRGGPSDMIDRSYRFAGEIMNSCVGLGRNEGFIVVRRNPVLREFMGDQKSQFYLSAIGYQPSWLDWFVRIFSDDNWHYAGEYLDPAVLGLSQRAYPR